MSDSNSVVPWQKLAANSKEVGIVVVDHGSRRAESNDLLLEVVAHYEKQSPFSIVEPAHMELAEPSLGVAFGRCVERGAKLVIVHPYFLLPGRHWNGDIPQLAAEAAARYVGVRYLVTAPLGLHPLMASVMQARIEQCLSHAVGDIEACDLCQGTDKCQFRNG
jgi:sirohydrochlorin ferrochelatase